VEAVERYAELLHKLKRDIDLLERHFERVGTVVPWAHRAPWTERIATRSAERMPPRDSEAKVFLHRFAFDYLVRIVVTEREGIF
jgi:hypothetical protein